MTETRTWQAPPLGLYVDVTLRRHDPGAGPRARPTFVSFGPFTSRERAELALVALAGRGDVVEAHVRDPEGESA
jgi:hypothetical protein